MVYTRSSKTEFAGSNYLVSNGGFCPLSARKRHSHQARILTAGSSTTGIAGAISLRSRQIPDIGIWVSGENVSPPNTWAAEVSATYNNYTPFGGLTDRPLDFGNHSFSQLVERSRKSSPIQGMPPFCSAPSRSSATRIFPSYWTVAASPFCNRTRAAKCSFDSARAAWADIVQLSRPSPTSYFRQTPLSRVLECRRVRPHPSPRRRIRPHWGKATFSTSKLNAGAHSISAHYKGSRNFAVSTSKAVSEQVN